MYQSPVTRLICLAVIGCTTVNAHALVVTMSAKSDGGTKPSISGVTNLPDGTDLMLTITRRESSYSAQNKFKVVSGKFKSAPFTFGGEQLNPGLYKVVISTPIATLLPASTWSVVGEQGEKMSGPLVTKTSFGGKTVKYTTTFNLGAGPSSPEKDTKSRVSVAKDKEAWIIDACRTVCTTTSGDSADKSQCIASCKSK